MIRLVGSILVLVAAVQALEWLYAYHRQTSGGWRKSEVGRHLMAFGAAIAAVLTLAAVRIVFVDFLHGSEPTWYRGFRVAVFAAIPFVLAWQRWLFVKVQRRDRNEEH